MLSKQQIIFWIICSLPLSLFAQTYTMNDPLVTDCSGIFFDSGGPGGTPYPDTISQTTTICSDGNSGTHMRLSFSNVDIAQGDTLFFYDGTTANPDSLIATNTDFGPTSNDPNAVASSAFIIQATVENLSGCLTVVFQTTDDGQAGNGWEALISCGAACQNFFVELVNSDPIVMPVDTGYIDTCPGQEISLTARGIYPKSGVVYTQNDVLSNFEWTMDDGSVLEGPDITYTYDNPGGYVVQLVSTDQNGCKNLNFFSQRVRIAPPPIFNTDIQYPICLGDTVSLTASTLIDDGPDVLIQPGVSGFPVGGIRADSLPLPDGVSSYQTSISIEDFAQDKVLETANDLESICIDIEHSYLFDLDIILTCPNGQSDTLQRTSLVSGSISTLGIPYEIDDGQNTGDNGHIQGIGFDYCFSADASTTWNGYIDDNGPGQLPSGEYLPVQNFDQLVGCPLNGEWTLEIADRLPSDNGWIFEWSLNFAKRILPLGRAFSPAIVDYSWLNNPEVNFYSPDSIATYGNTAGDINYVLNATDEFGCSWDTSLIVSVLPLTHPDCYECTELMGREDDVLICNPEPRQLDVTKQDLVLNTPVTYTATPNATIGFENNPPARPFQSVINVGNIVPNVLNDPATQFLSVCVDLETDAVGDLSLFLQAPSGQLLELSTLNGGSETGYPQTCFTPTATSAIDFAFPPFAGDFLPEGDFNDLIGASIDGDWTLLVSDDNDINEVGTLKSWSISFQSSNEVTYSWSPSVGLSCDDCPNPLASPNATTNYVVTARDLFGCEDRDTIVVAIASDLPQPVLNCEITANGEVTFFWERVENFSVFDIRIIQNGVTGDWLGPVTDLSYVFTGLNLLDTVSLDLQVFADPNQPSCENPVVRATCVYSACVHEAQIEEVTPVSCFDQADGTITAIGTNGAPPYLYSLDDITTSQDTGFFSGLSAGNHLLIIQDQTGCLDTTLFEVPAPLPLTATIELEKAVSCRDGNDGILRAMVSGGTGAYSYVWTDLDAPDTNLVSGLSPGTYEVIINDENNCSTTATFTLSNPEEMQVELVQIPTSCFDSVDGSVITTINGGTPDYTYLWDTGSTIAEPIDFAPGEHCVTITDGRGCQQIACITVLAPDPVVVDSVNIVPASCFDTNTGSATLFVSGGDSSYTYLWSDNLQQISQEAVRLRAGSYTVAIADGNGCQTSSIVDIPQPDVLEATIVPEDAKCFGSADGIASATVIGGTSPFNYTWPSGGTASVESDLSSGTYQLSVTDARGCETIADVFIGQPANPVSVQAVQIDQGCAGTSENVVEATASGGTGNTYTFGWNDPLQQSTPIANGLDSSTYIVTAMDTNGCIGADTIKLNDLPLIMIGIIANSPSCPNATDGRMGINQVTGGMGADDLDNYSFRWSTGQTSLTIDGLTGNTDYSITATDSRGCQGIQTRFLPEPDTISFELAVEDVSCYNGNDGTATISNIVGESNNYTVSWGTATGGQTGLTATNLRAGNYVVTVNGDRGCSNASTINVSQPEPITIEFQTEDISCFGGNEGSITANATGGRPDYVFNWSNSLPSGSTVNNLVAGTYNLTVTDSRNCPSISNVTIEEPETVAVNLTVTNVSCFGGRDGRIEVNTIGGTPPYSYSTDNINFNGISTLIGLEANNLAVYVRDDAGCLYAQAVAVAEPPEFMLDAGPDITINLGDTVNLDLATINAAGNIADIFWSAPYEGTLSCEQCDNPDIWPQNTIYYTVTGYDGNGCEAEDQIRVTVEKPRVVLVPSGFTPNGDQVNDRLLVHGREGTQIKVFRIFDRWGELLYEQHDFPVNDPTVGWDGTFRGQALNSGVYIWYLEAIYPFDQQEERFKGQTTLIR